MHDGDEKDELADESKGPAEHDNGSDVGYEDYGDGAAHEASVQFEFWRFQPARDMALFVL